MGNEYNECECCPARTHLGAQVALGSHVVRAVQIGVIIALRAPADLAHQAELERVDGTEHQLLFEEGLRV